MSKRKATKQAAHKTSANAALSALRREFSRAPDLHGPLPRVDTGEPRQGDDMEQGGLDVTAPAIG